MAPGQPLAPQHVERLGLLQQLLDVLPELTAPFSAEAMAAINARPDMRWTFLEVRAAEGGWWRCCCCSC